jgi:hypothetical protein
MWTSFDVMATTGPEQLMPEFKLTHHVVPKRLATGYSNYVRLATGYSNYVVAKEVSYRLQTSACDFACWF